MPTLRSEISVNAPAEKVYAYLSDFKKHPEWASNPLTIQPAEDAPLKAGAVLTSVAKLMGEHRATLSVVELTDPSRIVFDAKDDSGQFRHTIEIHPEGTSTLLTKTVTMTGGGPINRAMAVLLMPVIGRRIIKRDVQRIKERVEAT